MSEEVFSTQVQCPYCWETVEVLIDHCGEDQQYIEDCAVCCRPIMFHIRIEPETEEAATENVSVHVYSEDE